jgi:hypothetical protein
MRPTEKKTVTKETGKSDPVEQKDPQPMDEAATDLSGAVEISKEETHANDGDKEDEVVSTDKTDTGAGADVDSSAVTKEEPLETERPGTSSFARLVKGWEALAEAGARNVQRARENESFAQPLQMLQQLRLCGAGEGLARIGGPNGEQLGDPFDPIVLRHTRSTPQQYQPMFPEEDGGGKIPPGPVSLENARRSSSTPSSSAFRRYSSASAFSGHLRSMPHLGGSDDRSAFTLPAQRNSSVTSSSDPGVRFSAFDPVWLPQHMTDATENTAIEVTADKTSDTSGSKEEEKMSKSAASRAARFLRMSESRNKRRKKRKGEKETPARPTTISVTSQVTEQNDVPIEAAMEEEHKPSEPPSSGTTLKDTIDMDAKISCRTPTPRPQFPTMQHSGDSDAIKRVVRESEGQYQQLDSDVDEEYEHFQRIETSLQQTESPTLIPSPAYQKFEDEQVGQTESNTGDADYGNRTPTVRIQVSADATTTPTSQDSGNQSPGTIRSSMTGNTSGHTTIATSTTSGTVSSGHVSVLSSVSETDMEVMETNKAGKIRVRRQRKLDSVVKSGNVDGCMSVHSSSTGSTNTNGYVALVGSPAPLREGASMPVDRFFDQSRIAVAHSVSNISGSTGSSGSAGGRTSRTSKTTTSRSKKTGKGSPASVGSEMATTNSSGSAEDPPRFVSYLDQDKNRTLPPVGDEERESPSEIVGYSSMVFEAASGSGQKSERPSAIRPVEKRDTGIDRPGRIGSRPPLSPIKGLRTPTTPPPSSFCGPDSTSPAYHQLSPPRNIIDHRMSAGLSKPYVLRSSARGGSMFVSPESETVDVESASPKGLAQGIAISPEQESQADLVYTYGVDESQNLNTDESVDLSKSRICEEMSIEVKEHAPVVSPEKGA